MAGTGKLARTGLSAVYGQPLKGRVRPRGDVQERSIRCPFSGKGIALLCPTDHRKKASGLLSDKDLPVAVRYHKAPVTLTQRNQ